MLEDVSSIIACTLCKPKYVYLQYISTSAYISYQQSLFPSCWTKTESPFPPPPSVPLTHRAALSSDLSLPYSDK